MGILYRKYVPTPYPKGREPLAKMLKPPNLPLLVHLLAMGV